MPEYTFLLIMKWIGWFYVATAYDQPKVFLMERAFLYTKRGKIEKMNIIYKKYMNKNETNV